MILRGDIPYPTGLCLNESEARAKLGFELLSDYSNVNDFKLQKYAELQSEYSIKRLSGESLLRWRDRVFTGYIEHAGRDNLVINDKDNGKNYLILMIYLDFVEFDEEITYAK